MDPLASPRLKKQKPRLEAGQKVEVVFKGQYMSYNYLAAHTFFKSHEAKVNFVSCEQVEEIFKRVACGTSAYGVIPLESSSYGTFLPSYDQLLLSDEKVQIIGEVGQIERPCLCIKDEENKSHTISDVDVQRVVSHPHIFDCCSDYLNNLDARRKNMGREPVERVASWNSAAACAAAAAGSTDGKIQAAIGSQEAASLHHLKVLQPGIGNDKNAETRYVIITRAIKENNLIIHDLDLLGIEFENSCKGGTRKRSLAMALRNIPGAIFKMTSCFAFRNMDIFKIESRPATIVMHLNNRTGEVTSRPYSHKHWDLIFYVDYGPSGNPEINEHFFANLQEYCVWIKDLGSYTSNLQNIDSIPSEWSGIVDVVSC